LHAQGVTNELVADFEAASSLFSGSVEVLAAYTAFHGLVGK
jgi:hypothetical protein